MSRTTLPTDSNDRKNYALFRGCLRYFPAALAGVAKTSKLGNDKHNLGQEMHHDRNKSQDHGDCILRHLMDTEDLLAAKQRGEDVSDEEILIEASSLAWRALAFSQILHEQFGSPLAPGAKADQVDNVIKFDPPKAKFKFAAGDMVTHISNDGGAVKVAGNYYDANLKPWLFVMDDNGKTFAVDENFYKHAPIEMGAGV